MDTAEMIERLHMIIAQQNEIILSLWQHAAQDEAIRLEEMRQKQKEVSE